MGKVGKVRISAGYRGEISGKRQNQIGKNGKSAVFCGLQRDLLGMGVLNPPIRPKGLENAILTPLSPVYENFVLRY